MVERSWLAAVLCQSLALTINNSASSPSAEEEADVSVMDVTMVDHPEVVEAHHRFSGVTYQGESTFTLVP